MYTPDLINDVMELYPDQKEMHKLAQSGNAFLGRYLDDASGNSAIHIDKILLATSLDTLQKEARLLKRRVELYKKWCKQDPRPKIG